MKKHEQIAQYVRNKINSIEEDYRDCYLTDMEYQRYMRALSALRDVLKFIKEIRND